MAWHHDNRSTDDIFRVPTDSPAWKHIEEIYPTFKNEPRNLRLGLAMDGVNPFGLRSSSWSTWPVCLVNYNLPPWLAIKKGHLLLSLIIPGKHKVKNMDVYMAPLIEELLTLWNGIQVVDMSKPVGHRASMIKGILMWTMHDWPGYGECSGLTTSGYNGCPICGSCLDARYSHALKKTVCEGSVRYLPEDHELREGNLGRAPLRRHLTAADWKKTWESAGGASCPGMKRLSIFHSLPYWEKLLINHLLDPMHIFKNVGETIWKTITGKNESKGQRDDLQFLGRMEYLWARTKPNGQLEIPKAPWVLRKAESNQVRKVISEFRTPTGHMHCLKGVFNRDDKLSGLKTHDWHKLLQFVLPIALKNCLSEDIRTTIFKISSLVRWISSKEIRQDTIEAARLNAIEAACLIEKFFPTTVLTIQMHLLLHVVDEVAIAGTVHSRWMFFLERFMKTLKGFVRQRARPEGSMAEGWLVQESLVYITEFLSSADPDMPRLWTPEIDMRITGEEAQGKGIVRKMDSHLRDKINKFCILNSEPMEKWIAAYEEAKKVRQQERAEFRRRRSTRTLPYPPDLHVLPAFPTVMWLDNAIRHAKQSGEHVSKEEEELALGCDWHYHKFGALWSHGRHFRVEKVDRNRATFDCGVLANFLQESRASASDTTTEIGQLDYFGTLQDILKVSFRRFHMFIFDVQWFKVVMRGANATVRRDPSGLIQVDSMKLWTDARDTMVMPTHCEQVIFKADPIEPRWWYVVQVAPRSKPICEGLAQMQVNDIDVAQPNSLPVPDVDVVEEEEDAESPSPPDIVEQDEEVVESEEDIIDDGDCEDQLEIDALARADLAEDERMTTDN